MNTEATVSPTRAAQLSRTAAENGFNTSNNTSHYFLGGTQRSWMAPSQGQAIIDPNAARRSPAVNNASQSNGIGTVSALAYQENLAHVQDGFHNGNGANKRPRNEEQNGPGVHNTAARLNTLQQHAGGTPFYSFLPAPSLQQNTLANDYSNFIPNQDSDKVVPPHCVTGVLTSNVRTVHRRQSSMPQLPTQAQPFPQSSHIPFHLTNWHQPTGHSGLMWSAQGLNQVARNTASGGQTAPHPDVRQTSNEAHQRSTDTSSFMTMLHLPRLKELINDSRLDDWARRRASLLDDACNANDWFYLICHQLYCCQTLYPPSITELGFDDNEKEALKGLKIVWLENASLSPMSVQWFSHFPTSLTEMVNNPNPYTSQVIHAIKKFLRQLEAEWAKFQSACLARRYPPSPEELFDKLAMASTVLQKVFFTYIFRQIEKNAADQRDWNEEAQQFFKISHPPFLNSLWEPNSQAALTPEERLGIFAEEYYLIRAKYAERVTPQASTTPQMQSPSVSLPTSSGSIFVATPAMGQLSQPLNPHRPSLHQHSQPQQMMRRQQALPQQLRSPSKKLSRRSFPGSMPFPQLQPQAQAQAQARILGKQNVFQVPNPVQQGPIQNLPAQRAMQAPTQPASSFTVQSSTAQVYNAAVYANHGITQHRSSRLNQVQQGPLPLDYPQIPNPQRQQTQSWSRNPHIGNATHSTAQGTIPLPVPGLHATPPLRQRPNPLLSPPGKVLTRMTYPNNTTIALHQAHLVGPNPVKVDKQGYPAPELRLYQCVMRFAVQPQLLKHEMSHFKWQIEISAAELLEKAKDYLSMPVRPSSTMQREFRQGSNLYRLRCVRLPMAETAITESDWVTSMTVWPACCFVSLNGIEIDLRRKSHHGKDIPCDLTSGIQQGTNEIEFSILRGVEDQKHIYALGVELIEVMDHDMCLSMPSPVKSEVALASITKSLQISSGDDDDIEVVDAYISIDLIDPFLSKIFTTPTRGKNCIHRECFDLENFLNSRTTVIKDGPTNTDEWRCPICKKDARPQSLVTDGFLLQVKKELEAASTSGETAVRAIRVFADGSYKPVYTEAPSARSDDDDIAPVVASRRRLSFSERKEAVASILGKPNATGPVIIDLLDDD